MTIGELCDIKKYCREEETIKGKEIKTTVFLTLAFQLVFTAFNALQNLHSSLHDEENLGLVCLSALYGTGILSSVFAPTIIGLFGAKRVLLFSFAAHCIYILANFYPSWLTMVPTAVTLGASHGPAWTSQGLYISACAFSFSKSSSSSPYSVLSRFNNLFFAVFASTQIVGNMATSLFIRNGVGNRSEVFLFKYCGPNDCPASENATMIEDPDQVVVDLTLGFFMACALTGLFVTFFFLTPLPKSAWIRQVDIRKTMASFLNVSLSTNMMLLVPFIMFTAIEHAFLLGSFTKSYIACPIGIHYVGFVMAAYGVTTPIFFYLFIKLARVAGRLVLIILSASIHLVLIAFLFVWEPTEDAEALIFVLPMIWGVAESILQAQSNGLIAMLFPDQKEPAFANFHAWRSLGYCITFLNVAYLCVSDKLIVCMVCLVVGTGLYVYVEIKTKVREELSLHQKARPSVVNYNINGFVDEEQFIRNRLSSYLSAQDRLSYDHFELTDIIRDAETSWTRREGCLQLEVDRVMSETHLRQSKVTTLYHTRPTLKNFLPVPISQGMTRSKSDTYLSAKNRPNLNKNDFSQRHTVYFHPGNTSPISFTTASQHVCRCERINEDSVELDSESETGCEHDISPRETPPAGLFYLSDSPTKEDAPYCVNESNTDQMTRHGHNEIRISNGKSPTRKGEKNNIQKRLNGGLRGSQSLSVMYTVDHHKNTNHALHEYENDGYSTDSEAESVGVTIHKSSSGSEIDSSGSVRQSHQNGTVDPGPVSSGGIKSKTSSDPNLLERHGKNPLWLSLKNKSPVNKKSVMIAPIKAIKMWTSKTLKTDTKSPDAKSPSTSPKERPTVTEASGSGGSGSIENESDADSDGFVPEEDDLDLEEELNNRAYLAACQRRRRQSQLPVQESEDPFMSEAHH